MFVRVAIVASIALLFAGERTAVRATESPYPELSREAEIALALSAGPQHIRADAGVWVPGPRGYVEATSSRNGFTCLVLRTNLTIAPVCYDPEGTRTTFPPPAPEGSSNASR